MCTQYCKFKTSASEESSDYNEKRDEDWNGECDKFIQYKLVQLA